jgi:hypothetical protein
LITNAARNLQKIGVSGVHTQISTIGMIVWMKSLSSQAMQFLWTLQFCATVWETK